MLDSPANQQSKRVGVNEICHGVGKISQEKHSQCRESSGGGDMFCGSNGLKTDTQCLGFKWVYMCVYCFIFSCFACLVITVPCLFSPLEAKNENFSLQSLCTLYLGIRRKLFCNSNLILTNNFAFRLR